MKRDSRQILTELLVLRAQGGEDGAFTELHALWQRDVMRFAQSTVEDPPAAAEIAQDAWIAVTRGLARLEDPACFPRWLFQIVRRRAADWIRRQQRKRHARAELEQRQAEASAARTADADSPLVRLVEALPGEARELLTLYYQVGRTVAEIAEIYQVPPGTIKSRLHALRERLRNEIAQEKP